MFEKHHAKQAQHAYEHARGEWQAERDAVAAELSIAQDFGGDTDGKGLELVRGERLFASVTDTSLIEERRNGGHWQSGSQGVSVPIGSIGGHSVRYHVGASRGHYVQGTPSPTAIDTGTTYVTDRRVVFVGDAQTRECRFDKLLARQAVSGATTFSISNRQKPITIHYGAALDEWFEFRLDLALAHHKGTTAELVDQLEQQLAEVDGRAPVPPPPLPA
jgi:hypothetical protein